MPSTTEEQDRRELRTKCVPQAESVALTAFAPSTEPKEPRNGALGATLSVQRSEHYVAYPKVSADQAAEQSV